jgi:hypothetical protein
MRDRAERQKNQRAIEWMDYYELQEEEVVVVAMGKLMMLV